MPLIERTPTVHVLFIECFGRTYDHDDDDDDDRNDRSFPSSKNNTDSVFVDVTFAVVSNENKQGLLLSDFIS